MNLINFYLVNKMDSDYVVKKTGLMTPNDGFRAMPVCFLDGSDGFDCGLNIHISDITQFLGTFNMEDFQNNFKQHYTKKNF